MVICLEFFYFSVNKQLNDRQTRCKRRVRVINVITPSPLHKKFENKKKQKAINNFKSGSYSQGNSMSFILGRNVQK
jgi:hypothetical protein